MKHSEQLPPAIVRGRIQELTIFEVSEDELDLLERGSPDSLYLNLAVFLGTVAASFIVSLLTATVTDRVFIVLIVVTTASSLGALVLFVLWHRSRVSVRAIVRRVRDRVPPRGERLEGDEENT